MKVKRMIYSEARAGVQQKSELPQRWLEARALCGKIAEVVGFGGAFSFGYFSLGEQRKVTSP
jgi:hypothetical protein